MLKIYQNENFGGYNITVNGNDINNQSGSFAFKSFEVYPQTEVILFDRKNDLVLIHNGSTDKIALCEKLSKYVKSVSMVSTAAATTSKSSTPAPASGVNITFSIKKIPADGSIFINDIVTGKTSAMPTKSYGDSSGIKSLFSIIILILICMGVYYAYTLFTKKIGKNKEKGLTGGMIF